MQSTKSISNPKSARLSEAEKKKLSRFVDRCITVTEAAGKLGVPRYVLDSVLLKGSASPANIEIIKENLAA
jgi:hypothetical protein